MISTVNYESRSLSALFALASYLESKGGPPDSFKLLPLVLRSESKSVAPLEFLKGENRKAADDLLSKYQSMYRYVDVTYPDGEWSKLIDRVVRRELDLLPGPAKVIADISSMPSRVIFEVLKVLEDLAAEHTISTELHVVYAPAKSYPRSRYPSEAGKMIPLAEHEQIYDEASVKWKSVSAALVMGGQGVQAQQFVESLPIPKRISTLTYLNSDDLWYSLEVLRSNESLLYDANFNNDFYLSFTMGHLRLLDWAKQTPIDNQGACLIAHFGPKPLVVSAWLARRSLTHRILKSAARRCFCDVVVPKSHRYENSYSLGRKPPLCFSLPLLEKQEDTNDK